MMTVAQECWSGNRITRINKNTYILLCYPADSVAVKLFEIFDQEGYKDSQDHIIRLDFTPVAK